MKTRTSLLAIIVFAFIFQSCQKDESPNPIEGNTISSLTNSNNKSNETVTKSRIGNKKSTYTEASYQTMMNDLKSDVDNILFSSKPSDLTLYEYKIELIEGNYTLSTSDQDDIMTAAEDLIDYGIYYATQHNISIDLSNSEETMALGGLFSPNDTLEIDSLGSDTGYYYHNTQLTWGEVGNCAAVAIGADLFFSLGAAAGDGVGNKWTRKALIKAFGKVASRFLGPLGVAIGLATFGLCLGGIV